jgi:hypothetical protein
VSKARKFDQFKAGTVAVHISFYPNLVVCAFSELCLSLEERRDNVRLKNNHYSRHAIGSIVLLVTGFDSYLNEELMGLGFFDAEIRELAKLPTLDKYYKIIKLLGGTIEPNNELNIIIKLRDEIVHYLPRNISEIAFDPRRYLPEVFYVLDKKGLFYNPFDGGSAPFGQMVCSYRLAYWVWKNIDIAVKNFVDAFSTTKCPDHINHPSQYRIFDMYERITSPDNLATYDRSNELELTD